MTPHWFGWFLAAWFSIGFVAWAILLFLEGPRTTLADIKETWLVPLTLVLLLMFGPVLAVFIIMDEM